MSHALTIRSNDFAEFAAIHGSDVWHGLGQRLERGASIEEWAQAAGMGWRVERSIVRYATDREGTLAQLPANHVLLRSDTKMPLGIVSSKYQIVQPLQILETLKSEATRAGFELETAGTLHGGERIWAMASDGQEAEIGKGDRLLRRTLLTTSTNGSGATEGFKTDILVVCANTMRAATQGNEALARITHRSKYSADDMAVKLGLTHDSDDEFRAYADSMRRLADIQVSALRADDMIAAILAPMATSVADIDKVQASSGFRKISALFNGAGMGSTMDGRAGTAWGLLNAFTEMYDHHARATSTDNRIASAWFGNGDAMKTRAAQHLLALV